MGTRCRYSAIKRLGYGLGEKPKENKGEWIKIYPDHEEWNVYECSHCGEEFDLIEGTPYNNGYNFCPNCGADMRNKNNC